MKKNYLKLFLNCRAKRNGKPAQKGLANVTGAELEVKGKDSGGRRTDF
jgi:hypothetical protein